MKLRNKNLTFLFFTFILTSCAKKVVIECGTPSLMSFPSIESKVLSLRSTGIADTTIAFIEGLILGKDSFEKVIKIDTLPYTMISFINRESTDSVSSAADADGKFQYYLIAGVYDIQFGMMGYNRLRIENVRFRTGEKKELNVLLGHGSKMTTKVNAQNFNKE
jgi:hypothetical protein